MGDHGRKLQSGYAITGRPRWVSWGAAALALILLPPATAQAGAKPGKYNCVIEDSVGLFKENGVQTYGRTPLAQDHFVLSVQPNAARNRKECAKLTAQAKSAFYDGVKCRARLRASANNNVMGADRMLGNGTSFLDSSGNTMLFLIDAGDKGDLSFRSTEWNAAKDEQRLYRGSCRPITR